MAKSGWAREEAPSVMSATEANQHQMVIRPATASDAEGIAALHSRHISSLGKLEADLQFLERYYRELVRRRDCAVYVAQDDGSVVGYAALVKNQRQVLLSLLWHEPRFIGLLIRRTLPSRRGMQYLWFQFRHEMLGHKWGTDASKYSGCCELRSVAVSPECRRSALGTRLLQSCVAHARSRGWGPIISWVDEDNVSSQRLFEGVGFHRALTKVEGDKQVYLYFLDGRGDQT